MSPPQAGMDWAVMTLHGTGNPHVVSAGVRRWVRGDLRSQRRAVPSGMLVTLHYIYYSLKVEKALGFC